MHIKLHKQLSLLIAVFGQNSFCKL